MSDFLLALPALPVGMAGAIFLGTADEWVPEYRREGFWGAVRYFRYGLPRRERTWERNSEIKRLERECGIWDEWSE